MRRVTVIVATGRQRAPRRIENCQCARLEQKQVPLKGQEGLTTCKEAEVRDEESQEDGGVMHARNANRGHSHAQQCQKLKRHVSVVVSAQQPQHTRVRSKFLTKLCSAKLRLETLVVQTRWQQSVFAVQCVEL